MALISFTKTRSYTATSSFRISLLEKDRMETCSSRSGTSDLQDSLKRLLNQTVGLKTTWRPRSCNSLLTGRKWMSGRWESSCTICSSESFPSKASTSSTKSLQSANQASNSNRIWKANTTSAAKKSRISSLLCSSECFKWVNRKGSQWRNSKSTRSSQASLLQPKHLLRRTMATIKSSGNCPSSSSCRASSYAWSSMIFLTSTSWQPSDFTSIKWCRLFSTKRPSRHSSAILNPTQN